MSPLKRPQKILFFGDSITQDGGKADGFIQILKQGLEAENRSDITLINAGVAGNKITDLFLRFQPDLLEREPDQVVILIGVNDVWHQSKGTGTDLHKFALFYKEMIRQLQARRIKICICTPTLIGERGDHSNKYDGDLNAFSNVIREIAHQTAVDLLDLRQAFISYEQQHNPQQKASDILTLDGVHLNQTGHAFLAKLIKEKLAL